MDEEELKKKLSEEEYRVLRQKATEAPFSGKYVNEKARGMYKCKVCSQELFSSDTKFDSGTGWPSFDDAIPGAIDFLEDNSYGMERTEVICSKCKSHLGHVFDDLSHRSFAKGDDPTKTGKRYCINSVCLDLEKK